MPGKTEYQRNKERYGAEFMRKQSARTSLYCKVNKDKVNTSRRRSVAMAVTRIKRQAGSRGYAFELTDQRVRELVETRCRYCGVAPSPLNTVDRLDNTRGYTEDNVTPCCDTCNRTKGCLDAATFIKRCRHVSCVHGGPGELDFTCWRDASPRGITLAIYARRAARLDIPFELTQDQFDRLCAGACAYCGRQNSATHQNGIDRLDRAYRESDCVTCCSQCNLAKKKQSKDAFIALMKRIAGREHPDYSHVSTCIDVIAKRARTPNTESEAAV